MKAADCLITSKSTLCFLLDLLLLLLLFVCLLFLLLDVVVVFVAVCFWFGILFVCVF